VRFRVDGTLREVVQPNKALHAALISRLKIMAELDIAEKRLPQDGRISLRIGGRAIDVRVSTLPSSHGERAVLRLLDKTEQVHARRPGHERRGAQPLCRLIQQPHGIVLVTGPTGSGKTTTLYASLGRVDTATTNVLTVEDPVEYELPGIGQTQVNPKIDLTFAKALRAILRQDPDVIMIGEIRDFETAQIAIQASLTGHLVLATVHTNDAPSSRHAADRHGRRALPAEQQPAGRAGAAPGAQAVPACRTRRRQGPAGTRWAARTAATPATRAAPASTS
jgi:general secretion pathway protein E